MANASERAQSSSSTKSYRDQSERLFSKASLIPCSSYCSAVGIANGLCEGYELLFRQTHQPSQLGVITAPRNTLASPSEAQNR